jgi:putative ABC transport system ATP-binding protein
MNIIEIKNLLKSYGQGEGEIKALNDVDLTVRKGEFIAIMGPSGCGKSTLLNMLGCLDKPNSGSYLLDGSEISKNTSSKTLANIRRNKIGFIFQTFNLLSRTTALNNVILPAIYSGLKNRKQKAIDLLTRVGLEKRINHRPNQLSGGEQQRVAIARALMNDPEIILADEPTGNLDSKSGGEIMKLLKELNAEGKTIIAVTHDENIAKQIGKIIYMKDGKIVK